MLKVGDVAPEFILPDESGNEVSLTRVLGESALILYFYPADFTKGCTKEACAIRDMHDEILSVGLRVIGISPQEEDSHERFKDEHDLPFTLVSDPDKIAIRMYDADGPFGFGVRRITYLIGQGQKIQGAVEANVSIEKHREFIAKAVMLRDSAGMRVRQDPE
jgi:peroxiredoxin Q/BCP